MDESIIVGRDRELEKVIRTLDDAAHGHGSICYVTGEPGIGKSRLAEEVSSRARARGMRVFWGRCWEAGGAPAYWPWIQVLRALLRTTDPRSLSPRAPTLAQLLPELERDGPPPSLEPERARFQLMDAIGDLLAEEARVSRLLIVLEDLHAADVSTALLLQFLAASVRHEPLLILGTFRETQIANTPGGADLLRAAQAAHRISLGRLSRDEVASFVDATGQTPQRDLVEALYRITDGHPLFLAEVARLWRSRGGIGSMRPLSIPTSVRTAIGERLAGMSPGCARVLQRGAVVGREFDIGLLETAYQDDPMDYVAGCQEATDAAILAEVAPQRYRFLHFLIRQQVYEAIEQSDRADAHARMAQALRRQHPQEQTPWSEVAHHQVAAGCHREATQAYRNAGAQALRQLAFEDAVTAYEAALEMAVTAGELAAREHVELLLDIARAQTRAGEVAKGKKTSLAAADLAREMDDAELLAQAALAHGAALIFAKVDGELVALLREALNALGSEDGALRARVTARLAAALQPAADPQGPIELARSAIAMARRVADRETLLETLRDAGSTMVDLGDLDERLALDREHAALADQLGNPVEALRGNLRSIMDYLELGRLDDSFRTMKICHHIAERLDHPAHRWKSMALRVLRATWEGELDEAGRLVAQVRALGERAGDPNAAIAHAMQKIRLLQLRGDFDAQLPLLARVEDHWADSELGRITSKVIIGAEHVLAGRVDLAFRDLDAQAALEVLRMGDRTMEINLARLAIVAGWVDLAEQLYRRLLLARDRFVTGGVLHMTLEGPARWPLASIASFLEREAEAREHYEHALEAARRTGGRPVHASIALEYAQRLATSADTRDPPRALELANEARGIAQELGMRWLLDRTSDLLTALEDAPRALPASSRDVGRPTMSRIGDAWLLRYENVEMHLKNLRGVRLLAALVAEPGREFHVLDLAWTQEGSTTPIDRGDAGEILDAEARSQYKARILELKEELREAESWNDEPRVERARSQIAFIEQELSRAIGLAGRGRRASAATERARVNVQRRLKDAVRRIETHHPGLARHLERSIRTGTYCVYDP